MPELDFRFRAARHSQPADGRASGRPVEKPRWHPAVVEGKTKGAELGDATDQSV